MFSLIAAAVAVVVLLALVYFSNIFVYIPNDRVGVVERLWGAKSLTKGLIALDGEVGYQPQVLRGGLHYFFPFQYRVHKVELVTIPQGEIGYLFARDGLPLEGGQTLGRTVTTGFEDVTEFLRKGGQKGPQRTILREGTYALNMAQFAIITSGRVYGLLLGRDEQEIINRMGSTIGALKGFHPVIVGSAGAVVRTESDAAATSDQLGVVTVHDGPVLPPDEIVAESVGTDPANKSTFHNSFQDIEAFLRAGGHRGRQYQVLVEGTYYINRLFATVELITKTVVPVGFVGVVVSYIGKTGDDVSGKDYSHGELVAKGCRGVWGEPLLPGKYAFNPYAGKIQLVPTTNFILKWTTETTNAHKFDENLTEVSLITKDAFEPLMPLSVVVHIDYRKAPLVVQRFGDIKRLVDQTLDPMVSAYFKNVGQTKNLIELIQERADIQKQAGEEMKDRFADYNLELQEVLIGTPHGANNASGERIDTILNQLRDRQVAREQIATFELKQQSAVKERALREAQATTDAQAALTQSAISVQVAENKGAASVVEATKQAQVVRVQAEAERDRRAAEGEGQAKAVAMVGQAEAQAIKAKSEALTGEGAQRQLINTLGSALFKAVENGKIPLVPSVQVGGGAGGQGEGLPQLLSVLMAQLSKGLDPNALPAATKDTTQA